VTAGINFTTGLATWTFTSIDPHTLDLPADPLVGFLPPDEIAPQGVGFVAYTVGTKSQLQTGATINAMATVVFNTNAPLDTNSIFNTIDSAAPTSSVDPLPALTLSESLSISWAGIDDAGGATGSGVGAFDVFVAIDGGEFALWQANTNEHSAIYDGEFGHQYEFYSVATDHVGHRQSVPAAAQAMAYVTHQPAFSSTALTAAMQGVPYQYQITTADADGGESRAITATQLPTWLTLVDHGDGTATLSGTPGNAQVGQHAVSLRVTDSVGAAQIQAFDIQVANTNDAPTSIHLSRASVFDDLPGAWIAQVTVTDPDANDSHILTVDDPRFTINAGHLYLQAGHLLDRASEPAVTLRITATDTGAPPRSFAAAFVLIVAARPVSWDHAYNWKLSPFDVNADGQVTPLDAVLIINELNATGPRSLPKLTPGTLHPLFLDVSADDALGPLDALLIINELNAGGGSEGESPESGAVDEALSESSWQLDGLSWGSLLSLGEAELGILWDTLERRSAKR